MPARHNGPLKHVFQTLSCCQQNLAFHQIHVSDHFSDRMLHLDTRIHLDEVQAPILIHKKFNRSGVDISDFRESLAQNLSNLIPQLRGYLGGWRLLQQFLMTPLDAAFTLPQADHVSILIGENLKFDMTGPLHEFFHVKVAVAEGCRRFRLCRLE